LRVLGSLLDHIKTLIWIFSSITLIIQRQRL
jgi:hypothetical protein